MTAARWRCFSYGSLAIAAACGKHATPPPPAPAEPSAAEVQIGKPAPDFTATTYDGKAITLSSLKGTPVVIYFYPKDETPGCTREACSFRDTWNELSATHATLIGVSMDNAESHKQFVEHWKLPFALVSDTDGAIAAKYGVPLKKHGDATFEARQTFVIGADGLVRKIYREVDVATHASQVLADLKP